jgi:hypothetical protein
VIKRLTKAQGVQFLREINSVVAIPPGTKMFAIYAIIDERDGVTATIAMDEPIIDAPARPAIIERDEHCTDYAGL